MRACEQSQEFSWLVILLRDVTGSLKHCLRVKLAESALSMVRLLALPAEQRRPPAGYFTLSCFLQDKQEALPFLSEPHDALRLGVRSLKEDASVSHPVEAIQANVRSTLCREYVPG